MSHDTEKQAPESVADQIRAVVDKAQEKAGEVVDSLVKEGEKLRDQTRKLAEEKVGEMKERVGEVREMVEGAKTKAVDTLDNLEQLRERVRWSMSARRRISASERSRCSSTKPRVQAMRLGAEMSRE